MGGWEGMNERLNLGVIFLLLHDVKHVWEMFSSSEVICPMQRMLEMKITFQIKIECVVFYLQAHRDIVTHTHRVPLTRECILFDLLFLINLTFIRYYLINFNAELFNFIKNICGFIPFYEFMLVHYIWIVYFIKSHLLHLHYVEM